MQIAISSIFLYFAGMFKKRENIFEVEEGKILSPKFDANGLIPVITTDSKTGEVLMHGYMNDLALKLTIEKKRLTIGAELKILCGTRELKVVLYKRL